MATTTAKCKGMNKITSTVKKIPISILLLTSFLVSVYIIKTGARLRWLGYERIPDVGIFDERNYALQGLSIRNNGIPLAWSDSGAYEHGPKPQDVQVNLANLSISTKGLVPSLNNYANFPKPIYVVEEYDFGFGKQQLKLVQPFMDHSPIGGLISSLGFDKKVTSFLEITPDKYRIPPLYLGVINSLLLFVFSYLVTNNIYTALISIGIYNSVPTFVFSSRFALLENYLIPVFLLQIILIAIGNKFKKYSNWTLILSGLLAGLGIIVKETGIGYFLASLTLLFVWKYNRKEIISFSASAIIPCIIYTFWCLWLSPQLFKEIFIFNSSRGFFGSLNFTSILPSLRFQNFPLDGWWIWGFVSLLLLSITGKKFPLLIIPFLGHLFAILFIPNSNYPWYFLGIIPLLVVASAIVITKIIINPKMLYTIPFALLPLSSSLYWGKSVFNMPPSIMIYRLIVFGFIILSFFRIKYKSKFINILWVIVCIGTLFLLFRWNRFSVLYMIENWENLPVKSLPAL